MSRAVIAPPSVIYATIMNAFPILMKHTLSTLVEIMIGFMSASAVGIALGAAITLSTSIRQAFYPNIVFPVDSEGRGRAPVRRLAWGR